MVTFIAVREYYEVLKSVPGMRVRLEKPLMREDLWDRGSCWEKGNMEEKWEGAISASGKIILWKGEPRGLGCLMKLDRQKSLLSEARAEWSTEVQVLNS